MSIKTNIRNQHVKVGIKMYFAIIGDIIESKKISERFKVQEKLEGVLAQMNEEYAPVIASNFTITIGDEFQGLLLDSTRILEIIDKIKISMQPVDIRFGIGVGEITTKINNRLSIGADGPAYWNAREAILEIHNDNDYGKARILIKSDENKNLIRVMNESLRLCDYIESRWRDTQKEVVERSILKFGYDLKVKQTELAQLLSLSTQALNQRIQSSGYYNYIRVRKEISETMNVEWGENNGR